MSRQIHHAVEESKDLARAIQSKVRETDELIRITEQNAFYTTNSVHDVPQFSASSTRSRAMRMSELRSGGGGGGIRHNLEASMRVESGSRRNQAGREATSSYSKLHGRAKVAEVGGGSSVRLSRRGSLIINRGKGTSGQRLNAAAGATVRVSRSGSVSIQQQ